MEGGYGNKIGKLKWFFILLGLAIFIYIIWFLFFSFKTCDSWDCFNNNLERCSRATFIGGDRMIFEYTIRGTSGESCVVNVKLLQGELNNQDSIKLEGKEMRCSLPSGIIMIPESNIGNCHGELKEGLQDLVIKKLHTYLVRNLGKLNLELIDGLEDLEI
ncbi:MAG: hypothetical protein IH845_04050 [Nanoarchaeota archaeon]|nr:hypothetical protein [Nanoarchaeota archaeon]